ncbi:MAG: M56 family metallopeptidase [Acidobacteriota bacterium]
MSTPTIASWLLTYLLHSTVFLALAFVISRLLGEKHLALQETLLRAALIGGILTASLQVGLGIRPAVGVFHVAGVDSLQGVVHSTLDQAVTTTQETTAPAGLSETVLRSLKALEGSWPVWLLSIWGAGMLVSLLKLGRSALDLRRLLTTRRLRPADRLFARLTKVMGFRRSVLLSTSRAIAMPFATGIRQPEVCCPERVDDLAIEHQEGLYAHELAHLARRDPSWQLLYRLGEALLCLQPLNRIVRSRLEEIAEHLTDDRAVA